MNAKEKLGKHLKIAKQLKNEISDLNIGQNCVTQVITFERYPSHPTSIVICLQEIDLLISLTIALPISVDDHYINSHEFIQT